MDASETVTTTRAHAVLIYLGLSLKDCYIFCLIWYICKSKQEVLSMYGGLLERGSSVVQIIAPVTTGKYIHFVLDIVSTNYECLKILLQIEVDSASKH